MEEEPGPGQINCLFCGKPNFPGELQWVPKHAKIRNHWRNMFGELFFYRLVQSPRSKQYICPEHMNQAPHRFAQLNCWPWKSFERLQEMQDSKDFELGAVKVEEEQVEEEELEEDKPPILAPPPAIPQYNRGPPPAKQRRMAFHHNDEPMFLNIKNTEIFSTTSSEYSHSYTCVDRCNEELSIRFLLGNGLPLTKVEDPYLKSFLYHLNPQRAPPEVSHLITVATSENRPTIDYTRKGTISVSIEAIRKSDEVFLSISVHFYGVDGERRNHVHFEKVILADYEGRVVADRLRRVIDPKRMQNFTISNIVSPNIRMVQLLAEHTRFKNKFICFFSYLSNIAREVIAIDEFYNALKAMRKFIEALRKNPEVQIKVKRLQQTANLPITDIPNLDVVADWLSTLHFLSQCGVLNDVFLNLNEGWCMPPYLTEDQENALANLTEFLANLCHVATEICSADSCVSQVLYSMSIINNAIESCGIRSCRVKMRSVFSKYFTSISTGRIGDFYSIAALLDPRYGHSYMIYGESDWENVEKKLIKDSCQGVEQVNQRQIEKEVNTYKQTMLNNRPDFTEENLTAARWWNSVAADYPMMYKKWIEYSCPPAVSIDGKRMFGKGGKLAHLFMALDEVLHHKATMLAQNSQDFVGRGHASHLIFNQVNQVISSNFRRREDEPDMEGGEELETKHDIEEENLLVIKDEEPEDPETSAPDASETSEASELRDVKEEEEPHYN